MDHRRVLLPVARDQSAGNVVDLSEFCTLLLVSVTDDRFSKAGRIYWIGRQFGSDRGNKYSYSMAIV
jgi:hypothetical protein